MVPNIERIHNLAKDILEFRERLLNEIPDICDPDSVSDLGLRVSDVRSCLLNLYKDLDQILVDNDC